MTTTEEELLQKTATILEIMISDDDFNESCAEAADVPESARFHECRGTALSYALELVQDRARTIGVELHDFCFPEDKTTDRALAEVALRRARYQKSANQELEWLRRFACNADFGPASGDVQALMREGYESKTGRKVPSGWRGEE